MNLCWNLWSCWNNWRWWHGLPDSAFFGTGCLWKKWWKDNIHGLEWIGRNFPGSHSAATRVVRADAPLLRLLWATGRVPPSCLSVLGSTLELCHQQTHYRYLTCRKEIEDYYRHSLISGLGGLIPEIQRLLTALAL